MSKKVTTIRLDGNVLDLARQQIPNLSLFIEDCLKAYLGLQTENINISTMQEELDKIKECNLHIHLLSKQDNASNIENVNDTKMKNDAWLRLWGTYRNYQTWNPTTLKQTSEILETGEQDLLQIMATLVDFVDKSKIDLCDDWKYANEKYREILLM